MNNRSLIYMTIAVVIGIAVLLFINLYHTFEGVPTEETYLKYNSVRGSAVEHDGKLYTLNFDQQNTLIQALNRSVRIKEVPTEGMIKPNFTKIVIYQFNSSPDINIIPIGYVDHNLVFSAPQMVPNENLMDLSRGKLEKLILQTFDQ